MSAWLLNAEQTAALVALTRARDLKRLEAALAEAFPAVPARLADRYGDLIALGAQRGAAHGLTHLLCIARYLACWCAFGAEFESKPGFEWAAAILGAPRGEGAKAFQLCRRARDELIVKRPGAAQSQPSATEFLQALALLDERLRQAGALASLLPRASIKLGQPCDLDALDLRLIDHDWRREYRQVDGLWQREPCGPAEPERRGVTLSAGIGAGVDSAAALPEQLTILSQPAGSAAAARLRVRSKSVACCDAQVHPLLSLTNDQGLRQLRGPRTADLSLTLHADAAPPPPPGALAPTIAHEGSPALQRLELASCGLRDSGAPLEAVQTRLAIYPAEQHLLAWRREPLPAIELPGALPDLGALPAPRCRLERDGAPLDAAAWIAGLQALDRQLVERLGALLTAWERTSGVEAARLSAEPALLAGTAALTWGWTEGATGLAAPPQMRVEGLVDLLACRLRLRLAGRLHLDGSTSLVQLHCDGEASLRQSWRRHPEADLATALKPLQLEIRFPFTLAWQPLAAAELALLTPLTAPRGALVGRCGLRPRPGGPGLQFFAELAIEPVAVALRWDEPLLGSALFERPLLPAFKLLDWSLG